MIQDLIEIQNSYELVKNYFHDKFTGLQSFSFSNHNNTNIRSVSLKMFRTETVLKN